MIIKEWQTKAGVPARVILNTHLDAYCGYIGFDRDSGYYEIHYMNLPVANVHGGITFSDSMENSNLWWIGFDCAHYQDYSKFNIKGKKRDLSYCIKECEKLAIQLVDTPVDYLFRFEKYGKLPSVMHNKMLAWHVEDPENMIIKKYFSMIK